MNCYQCLVTFNQQEIMKSIRTLFAALLVTAFFASTANATTVSFNFSAGGGTYGSGSFSGVDSNGNGVLSKNELASFTSDLPPEGVYGLALADLFDFGTYNIAANVWNADASGWGNPNFAWYSWNGGNNSVNPRWAVMTTAAEQSTVPEPGSLALIGLGLAGLAAASRKRNA
jgi:hypothetical protein